MAGEVEAAVEVALKVGYRHLDTAQTYQNEAEIGRSVSRRVCARERTCLLLLNSGMLKL